MAATAEEEAIIRKRYLTQTVQSGATTGPAFKNLVKKCAACCARGTEVAQDSKWHAHAPARPPARLPCSPLQGPGCHPFRGSLLAFCIDV